MEIYPSDSASQVGGHHFTETYDADVENVQSQQGLTREEETRIASRVRDNVREFIAVKEKINKFNSVIRELRKKNKELQQNILSDMRLLEVENLALNSGKLVAKHSHPKVSLTKTSIVSMLSRHFTNDTLVQSIVKILYDERDREEKVKLIHSISKKS